MKNNTMGIIMLTEREEQLSELTYDRTVGAIPFGGRYRLIDFVLSNMVNSGIRNVGVFAQHKYRSLMEHLRMGKDWDLHRKRDGLFILPPNCPAIGAQCKEELNLLERNLDYLQQSRQEYVLMAKGNGINNMDYHPILAEHIRSGAHITAVYARKTLDEKEAPLYHQLELDKQGYIEEIKEGTPGEEQNMSLEVYLLRKSLLLDIIAQSQNEKERNFIEQGVRKNLGRLKSRGYEYRGYAEIVNSSRKYYQCNRDLLNRDIYNELFFEKKPIYTKKKDEAPTKYTQGASVNNSIIASGCIIKGHVENSILFRGVVVEEGAKVVDSIVFPKVTIQGDSVVQQAILEKGATVNSEAKIGTDQGLTMIKRNAVI
ncbi:glucose-1-phosphate adenylyltransferase [Desulfitispora alkaliphila]|uniref:glucose-1-phosphate adenylyltransferase subunit GlgD n=1 Tax=Desulfitispora alkaliphila TaxID=622674 RepID=UPI003D1CA3C6